MVLIINATKNRVFPVVLVGFKGTPTPTDTEVSCSFYHDSFPVSRKDEEMLFKDKELKQQYKEKPELERLAIELIVRMLLELPEDKINCVYHYTKAKYQHTKKERCA